MTTRASASGRPPRSLGRKVPEDILAATRLCLAECSHTELTVRDIARRAGTSQEMIHYYFSGKDGLLLTLIRDLWIDVANALQNVHDKIDAVEGDPTKHIVNAICDRFYEQPGLARIIMIEYCKSSSWIISSYTNTNVPCLSTIIKDLIAKLSRKGVYRSDLDCSLAAYTISAMIMAPLSIPSMGLFQDNELVRISRDKWISHIIETLNAEFRSGHSMAV